MVVELGGRLQLSLGVRFILAWVGLRVRLFVWYIIFERIFFLLHGYRLCFGWGVVFGGGL